ncbi:MAG: hypothetical protein KDD55_09400, partial [Bdellovibrionales bacterium]|nr:hypothetical protein [Bdellovibrionales bacterium]
MVEVGDPFAAVTINDGGNIIVPEGWMNFHLFDGTNPVAGATFRFEQNDGAGGGVGLVKNVVLPPGESSFTFEPYAPVTEGIGACGYSVSQLFDELPETNETTWTVTAAVPLSWYSGNGYPTPSEL